MVNYLDANEESGKEFYRRFYNKGRIVLLNLLKFKEIADYSSLRNIKPAVEITGEEAYRLYLESTILELEKVGSRILYYGKSGSFLIGPQHQNGMLYYWSNIHRQQSLWSFPKVATILKVQDIARQPLKIPDYCPQQN